MIKVPCKFVLKWKCPKCGCNRQMTRSSHIRCYTADNAPYCPKCGCPSMTIGENFLSYIPREERGKNDPLSL